MKFSFIIPAKNEETSLPLCIKSIREQNYRAEAVQIVVIDDYSTDKTFKVAKDCGVTVLTPDFPSGKTTRARNKNLAAQQCDGDYLIFLDAHIVLPSTDWLDNVEKYIQKRSERNLILSFPALPPPHLSPLLKLFKAEKAQTIALCATEVAGQNQFVGGSMLISKNAFVRLGGFPPIPSSEDISLYQNARKEGLSYDFLPNFWVWHLDNKLRSTKSWVKRSLKEGYYSAAYGSEYTKINKIGKLYSILLGVSICGGFFFYPFWVLSLFLLLINLLMHGRYAAMALKFSKGKMNFYHFIGLLLIDSGQALLLRLSAFAGMLTYTYLKVTSKWSKCL